MSTLCPSYAQISARCSDMLCAARIEQVCNRAGFRLVRYNGGWDFPIPTGYCYDDAYILFVCIDDLRKDKFGFPLDDQPYHQECEDFENEFCDHDGLIWLSVNGEIVMRGDASAWCSIHAYYVQVAKDNDTVFVDENNRRVWHDGKGMSYPPYP